MRPIPPNIFSKKSTSFFYYINALFFVENQNLYDLDKFAYGTWQPHLGTYIWAFFWNLMPIKLEYFGRLFYVFILCFSIFYVCHNNLRGKFNNVVDTDEIAKFIKFLIKKNIKIRKIFF